MWTPFIYLLLAGTSTAIKVVQSNDDGWAVSNVRTLFDVLTAAGHDVILSAPAENKSGSSSLDVPPTPRTSPCQFNSCPANSPATGFNASNPRLNYVNSYPVTSIRYGISTVAPKFFGSAKPELAVTGPNVGSNLGIQVPFSGTVGTAVYAAHEAKIPAIAFSGKSDAEAPWNGPTPLFSKVYADLALNLTSKIIASGKPYLPDDVFLNVNFPEVTETRCNNAQQFKFVASRIYPGWISPPDAATCGSTRLPQESTVVGTTGCYVSVSFGDATDKTDTEAAKQRIVLDKLSGLLTCLP
ncbi:putative acid phosphatase [Patellaria atrata CBS 101060]|uniref:Acid phosphatase n=1 Tax=Patellaria atrata CBS 101060 TaxID=1346257 RepID=A0A9P4SEN0_9PEZI|nr:putative acid phosphatase [Patellaria atrata CBS 101060]